MANLENRVTELEQGLRSVKEANAALLRLPNWMKSSVQVIIVVAVAIGTTWLIGRTLIPEVVDKRLTKQVEEEVGARLGPMVEKKVKELDVGIVQAIDASKRAAAIDAARAAEIRKDVEATLASAKESQASIQSIRDSLATKSIVDDVVSLKKDSGTLQKNQLFVASRVVHLISDSTHKAIPNDNHRFVPPEPWKDSGHDLGLMDFDALKGKKIIAVWHTLLGSGPRQNECNRIEFHIEGDKIRAFAGRFPNTAKDNITGVTLFALYSEP